jgi:uncharacterized protein YjbJ (UPF0337 family)
MIDPLDHTLHRSRPVLREQIDIPSVNWMSNDDETLNQMEIFMNSDTLEGDWKQLKGRVKSMWGKLTDDDLDVIAGKRDQLSGKIQKAYGVSRDEADKQIDAWSKKA